MKKIINSFFWVLLVQLAISHAHAALVTTSVDGYVIEDNSGTNPFGLLFDDVISLDVTYDNSLITGLASDDEYFIDGLVGWDFTMTLGSYSFSQADVTDPSYTSFFFNFDDFDGVRFYLDPVDIGVYTDLVVEDFDGGRALFAEHASGTPVYLEAEWDFSTAVTRVLNPVPEPPVMLLMLSGLIGIALMKKSAK